MDSDSFGLRLREARKSKGLTQKELAEKIGAKHNSVSNWENDQNKPDPDMIELICGELDITPNYLLKTCEIEFSIIEKEFVNKYRALDAHGRKVVDFILNEEYERITVPANTVALAYYPDIIPAGEGEYGSQDTEIINYPVDKLLPGTDIVVRMRGITMEPTYHSGDMLCVKKASRINKGDIGVFVVDGRGIVAELGADKLITHNTAVADIPLTPGVRCVGRVLGVY